jgi:hypothetical protein
MEFLQTGYGMAIWNSIITSSKNTYTAEVSRPQSDQSVRETDDKIPISSQEALAEDGIGDCVDVVITILLLLGLSSEVITCLFDASVHSDNRCGQRSSTLDRKSWL